MPSDSKKSEKKGVRSIQISQTRKMSVLGRLLPYSPKGSERQLRAQYPPPRLGFSIFWIERRLSRVKQTAVTYFLCADELQLAARTGHRN